MPRIYLSSPVKAIADIVLQTYEGKRPLQHITMASAGSHGVLARTPNGKVYGFFLDSRREGFAGRGACLRVPREHMSSELLAALVVLALISQADADEHIRRAALHERRARLVAEEQWARKHLSFFNLQLTVEQEQAIKSSYARQAQTERSEASAGSPA
jgi:hypothetical protein